MSHKIHFVMYETLNPIEHTMSHKNTKSHMNHTTQSHTLNILCHHNTLCHTKNTLSNIKQTMSHKKHYITQIKAYRHT